MIPGKTLSASLSAEPVYIEDVFSTFLYAGSDDTGQNIVNNINLSGEGGLVWMKTRNTNNSNSLYDTARGSGNGLATNSSNGQNTNTTTPFNFNNNGFFTGRSYVGSENGVGKNIVSWTFRKQTKFFDIVTYTGNGASGRAISHNLGSVPGCIIVKSTNSAFDWKVYHRSEGSSKYLTLNKTTSSATNTNVFAGIDPTASNFYVGPDIETNGNDYTYVAYLFAHDAGGFGDSGSDNVITCGSYTGNGNTTGPTVTLGYEPQWLLIKKSAGGTVGSGSSDWVLLDTMRGLALDTGGSNPALYPNTSGAEDSLGAGLFAFINATGFSPRGGSQLTNENGATYVYIAIRRGPMKTPTNATSVFDINYPGTYNPDSTLLTVGFPSDYVLYVPFLQDSGSKTPIWYSRLMSSQAVVSSSANGASGWGSPTWANQTQFAPSVMGNARVSVLYYFLRAPGFMDVVCYTGTGSATTQTHNLGVTPELMIVRGRSAGTSGSNWSCYHSALGNTQVISLNEGIQAYTSTQWNNTTPTASVFSIGTQTNVNGSGQTYVAYLFATIAGISKVGSYTGNGSSQTINCGFTGGARFVMIKRTDSTGDWVVFDTARGMVSGNDPYFALNNTDRDVTDKDAVDTDNTGFIVNETTGPNINTNSGTYIFLAIA